VTAVVTLFAMAVLLTPQRSSGTPAEQTNHQQFAAPTKCEAAASISRSAIGLPEARAAGNNAEAWALFFNPLYATRRVKIVWRMTGSGRFAVAAYSPNGTRIELRAMARRPTSG